MLILARDLDASMMNAMAHSNLGEQQHTEDSANYQRKMFISSFFSSK